MLLGGRGRGDCSSPTSLAMILIVSSSDSTSHTPSLHSTMKRSPGCNGRCTHRRERKTMRLGRSTSGLRHGVCLFVVGTDRVALWLCNYEVAILPLDIEVAEGSRNRKPTLHTVTTNPANTDPPNTHHLPSMAFRMAFSWVAC